jgi:hypothetical protein
LNENWEIPRLSVEDGRVRAGVAQDMLRELLAEEFGSASRKAARIGGHWVPLAAALASRLMAGANVHEPNHRRDNTDQDDAGSKYARDEAADSFGGDEADHQPSEHVSLTRERPYRDILLASRRRRGALPGIVMHSSRVTQVSATAMLQQVPFFGPLPL